MQCDDIYEESLIRKEDKEMNFTKKLIKSFAFLIYVAQEDLYYWLQLVFQI